MNNKYYNYPHKELWNKETWYERLSPVVPIAAEVGQKNLEEHRIPGKPISGQRTE